MTGPWIDLHAHPGRFFLNGLAQQNDAGKPAQSHDDRVTEVSTLASLGMTAIAFATVSDLRVIGPDNSGALGIFRDFSDGEAYSDHLRQLDAAHRIANDAGLQLISRGSDVDSGTSSGRPQMLLACEGADFIEDHYDRFGVSYDKGVRSVQLMHYRSNGYGDLQTQPERYGGLTAAGARIVREMNQLGILIDLAHASYRTTRDAVRLSDQPVMVSHTHLKHTRSDHPRLITPGHARLIAASGGVIGVWPSGHSLQTFEDFIQEIVRLVSLVGIDHVGIGTDMDSNYKPVMNSYDQWSVINDSLEAAGFSSAEIDKVLGGNAARLLGTVLG